MRHLQRRDRRATALMIARLPAHHVQIARWKRDEVDAVFAGPARQVGDALKSAAGSFVRLRREPRAVSDGDSAQTSR